MTVADLMLRLQRLIDEGAVSPDTHLAVPSTVHDVVYHHARRVSVITACSKWFRLIAPCQTPDDEHGHAVYVVLDHS